MRSSFGCVWKFWLVGKICGVLLTVFCCLLFSLISLGGYLMGDHFSVHTDSSTEYEGSEYSEEHRTEHHLYPFVPPTEQHNYQGPIVGIPPLSWKDSGAEYNHCLIGFLVDRRNFSSRELQNILLNVWRPRGRIWVVGR